jgi:GNAT superfamily N-acetyltransferase
MSRVSTPYGAFEIESLPSQPQIGVCHAFFVRHDMRGRGLAHNLKSHQEQALINWNYDYGLCTCDGGNAVQQRVLESAGWKRLDTFVNSKTGGATQLWGKPTREMN